jgi:hypothetical protein
MRLLQKPTSSFCNRAKNLLLFFSNQKIKKGDPSDLLRPQDDSQKEKV